MTSNEYMIVGIALYLIIQFTAISYLAGYTSGEKEELKRQLRRRWKP